MNPTKLEIKQQNQIKIAIGLFLILLMTTILLIGNTFLMQNSINTIKKENNALNDLILCQDVNERKIQTLTEIRDYLECELDQCIVLKRQYN